MNSRPRRQKAPESSELFRYRPRFDTLEDRLSPGNLLSASSNIVAGPLAELGLLRALASPPAGSKSGVKPSKSAGEQISILQANNSVVVQSAGLRSVQQSTVVRSGGSVSVTGQRTDAVIVNAFAAGDVGENAGPASFIKRVEGNAGSAGSSGERLSHGSDGDHRATGGHRSEGPHQHGGVLGGNGGTAGQFMNTANLSARSGGGASGHGSHDDHDHRYIDERPITGANPLITEMTAEQQQALATLTQQMPWLRATVDTQTGAPATLFNAAGPMTQPSALPAKDVVLNFLQANKALYGFSDADLQVVEVAHQYSLGAGFKNNTYVYLEQRPNGIPVYAGVTSASVNQQGQLNFVGNRMVPGLVAAINTANPVISPIGALINAVAVVGGSTSDQISATSPVGPEQDTILRDPQASAADIPVQLRYLFIQPGEARLVWNMQIDMPNSVDWFDINVDAVTGQVWTVNNLTKYDSYRVLRLPADSPPTGSFTIVNNPADPLANGVGSVPYPSGAPVTWHNIDGDPEPETFDTRGNNVLAQEDIDGDDVGGLRPTGRAGNDYNYPVDFSREPYTPPGPGTPADVRNIYAAVVQLFYSVNVTHDILYHYGFTEAAGNFQFFNFGRGGLGGDPVLADVQDPSGAGPSMGTGVEGTPPRLTMTLNFGLTTPARDSAFSTDIVIHEYVHGLSSRLVAGPFSGGDFGGDGTQSGAMGEGWSDYYALALTQRASHTATTNRTTGNWFLGQTQSALGVRRLAYNTNMNVNPLTYNDIDDFQIDVLFPPNPPVFPALNPPSEVHNAGEVWTCVLWDMHWFLTNKYGFSSDFYTGNGGNNIALKLVTEGLRLTPSGATMLQARDAILAADTALYGGANHLQIWTAFARRGMGQFASSVGGDTTSRVREDFTIPPIPGQPGGGPGGGGGGGSSQYPGNGQNDGNFEPNDFSNNAADLGRLSSQTKIGGLAIVRKTPQDRDWFRFRVANGGRVTVRADMASNAGDLDLRVYRRTQSGSLQPVGSSLRRRGAGSESVSFNANTSSEYYFQVVGYNGATGNYGVTITVP